MKNYFILILLLFPFIIVIGQSNVIVSHELLLEDDKNVKITLIYADSADLGAPDWLKLKIVNKSKVDFRITDANYSINTEQETGDGEKYIDYGDFGSGNKFELFHYYYDLENPSDYRDGVPITAGDSLISWKYLTNYASVLLDGHYGDQVICAIPEIKLAYEIDGKEKEIKNDDKQFCFHWTDSDKVPIAKLVERLSTIILHPHYQWVDSYVVGDLMKLSKVASAIPTEDLIQGILLRKNVQSYSESCHFLEELSRRNELPNAILTKHYKEKISTLLNGLDNELSYYWDNTLLKDLLASKMAYWDVARILEINSKYWRSEVENTQSIYIYLAQKLHYSDTFQIRQDNFKAWSEMIKTLSISRDTSFLNTLIPLLENETVYKRDDWSRYRYAGMLRKEDKPDTIQVRVCDVAFVALLRGMDQIMFTMNPGVSFYVSMDLKTDILDQEAINKFIMADLQSHTTLPYYEKQLILTPEWKAKVKELWKKMSDL